MRLAILSIKNISRRYITVTKLIYGWIKSEDKSK